MKRLMFILIVLVAVMPADRVMAQASEEVESTDASLQTDVSELMPPDSIHIEQTTSAALNPFSAKPTLPSIYELPYSVTLQSPDWHRLWSNTAVLTGAYVSTLFVLEMLPEDATTWNRASLQQTPFYERWWKHNFKKGPEWDSDNPVFNYILHPYAGAVYFMAARSNGFNFFGSLLYCTMISTIGWEFGIEACMERPSYQDLFITPLIGSAIGECFYRLKRNIVDNDYRLFGSPIIGNVVAFLIDPVNEVVGLFNRNPARRVAAETAKKRPPVSSALIPTVGRGTFGFSLSCTF